MTTETALLTADGIRPAPYQANSLRQAASLEPRGVYTVARTYHRTQAVLLDKHLDRLEESARLERIPLRLDRQSLRAALRQLLEQSDNPESRFRITIPAEDPDEILLALEPLEALPQSLKQDGVVAATQRYQRDNPRAKSNSWEPFRSEALEQLPPGSFEGLLVDAGGTIREGFSSNFYAIAEDRLRTAEEGILMGISRRILLEILPDDLKLDLTAVRVDEIPHLDEAFLTSSSRGVVPIIRIDQVSINLGTPGSQTTSLIKLYDDWVEAHLEPI